MTNQQKLEHSYEGNVCKLRLQLPKTCLPNENEKQDLSETGKNRRVENIRNCDIFVEDCHFIIYADVQLFKFQSERQFELKDMKNLIIKFNSKERCYEVNLPCLPQSEQQQTEKGELEKPPGAASIFSGNERSLDLWKLKRITEQCQLQRDNSADLLKFEANFDYGFACKFKGKISGVDSDFAYICRIPEPHLTSPLQRSIDREIDELKNFSRDQYKLNFIELQVPDGHDNPMKFSINYEDTKLSSEEECLLHNLTRNPEDSQLPSVYDQTEIDCGLLSLLLAICYDIRSTSNDATCESAWTRSILTPTLTYFEPFDSIKEVVISFMRRSLIYPLYRNYDLGKLCVEDAIEALQMDRKWLLKQLLATHQLFVSSDYNRDIFNRYYIEDYIRYVHNEAHCPATHMQMLSCNLKNVLLDVYKKHLRLELAEIETELLKELISDIHVGASEDESEGDSGDESDDGDLTETETSSASETEENSVIEQRLDALKL